jgi:hypothetical protein
MTDLVVVMDDQGKSHFIKESDKGEILPLSRDGSVIIPAPGKYRFSTEICKSVIGFKAKKTKISNSLCFRYPGLYMIGLNEDKTEIIRCAQINDI